MAGRKWSDASSKANPIGGDETLVLDSADSNPVTKQKRTTFTNLLKVSAKGDLLTHNGTTFAKISAGTDNQFLKANSAVSGGLEWITPDTDDIAEGTNLYYTQSRFDSAFGAKSTDDLSEGTNLYYTDARAIAAVEGASFTSLTASTLNGGNIKIAGSQIETTGTNNLTFKDSDGYIRFNAKTETQFRRQGVDNKSVLFGMSEDGTHGFCWAVHHGVNFLPLRIQTGSELLVGVTYDNNSSDKIQVLGNCSLHGGDYKIADSSGNSNTTVIDSSRAATFTKLNTDNIQIDADTISNTDTNGNVEITPNGTGVARLNSNAVLAAPNSAVVDATLGNSQLHPWLDESNSILKFKVKNSSGTVSTYEIGGTSGDGTFDSVRIVDGGTLRMDMALPDENYFTFSTYKAGELSDKYAIKLNLYTGGGSVLVDSLIAGTQDGNLGINQADPRANLHTTGSTILGLYEAGNILDASIGQNQAWIYTDEASDIIKLRYRDSSDSYHDYYINKYKTGQDLLTGSSVTFGSVSAGTLTSTGTISATGAASANSLASSSNVTVTSDQQGQFVAVNSEDNNQKISIGVEQFNSLYSLIKAEKGSPAEPMHVMLGIEEAVYTGAHPDSTVYFYYDTSTTSLIAVVTDSSGNTRDASISVS